MISLLLHDRRVTFQWPHLDLLLLGIIHSHLLWWTSSDCISADQ